jgi:hypothetical protein
MAGAKNFQQPLAHRYIDLSSCTNIDVMKKNITGITEFQTNLYMFYTTIVCDRITSDALS